MPRVPATDPAAEAARRNRGRARNRSEARHGTPAEKRDCLSSAKPPQTYLCLKYAGAHHAVDTKTGTPPAKNRQPVLTFQKRRRFRVARLRRGDGDPSSDQKQDEQTEPKRD